MEVEFSGDQEDDGLDGGEANVAAGVLFGSLKQPIEGFEEAVGLTGSAPKRQCPPGCGARVRATSFMGDPPPHVQNVDSLPTQNSREAEFKRG